MTRDPAEIVFILILIKTSMHYSGMFYAVSAHSYDKNNNTYIRLGGYNNIIKIVFVHALF